MIGRIKNIWLRRVAICLAIFPLTIAGAIIGAVSGGYEYAASVAKSAIRAWSQS